MLLWFLPSLFLQELVSFIHKHDNRQGSSPVSSLKSPLEKKIIVTTTVPESLKVVSLVMLLLLLFASVNESVFVFKFLAEIIASVVMMSSNIAITNVTRGWLPCG